MSWRADRRIYTTYDGTRVVDEGSSEAAFLLVGDGGEVPDDVAERLGLSDRPAEKARESGANKERARPSRTK